MSLANWSRRRASYGVLLADPRGTEWGMIRVRPGQPLRSAAASVAAIRARSPDDLEPSECRRIDRVVTDAGELAAVVELVSPNGVARLMGTIARSADAITFEGMCAIRLGRDAFVSSFEALIRGWATGHQADRIRMFEYRRPAGWRGLRRPLSTLWLAPEYPRDATTIEVYDAVPVGDTSAATLAAIALDRDCVEISDRRFIYRLRFSGADEHRATFDAMVDSIERLPEPTPQPIDSVVEFAWAL